MIANLIAFNTVEGRTSSGSVEFSGNPNDVIQLTINGRKYIFDYEGKLQYSSEVQSCSSNVSASVCATFPDRNGRC